MVMPGETYGKVPCIVCADCGRFLALSVLKSYAGYYIGFACEEDGPVSRESGYYSTDVEAQEALDSMFYGR